MTDYFPKSSSFLKRGWKDGDFSTNGPNFTACGKKHFKFGSFQEKDQIEKHGAHHIQYGFSEKAEFSCTICIYRYDYIIFIYIYIHILDINRYFSVSLGH